MPLYIPGTATADKVVNGNTFSAGTVYAGLGTMPLKTAFNGDGDGGGSNHHLAKEITGLPGVLYARPIAPADPITAFVGDLWIQILDPEFVAPNFRNDKNMFGLQGSMPVITAGADPAQGVAPWPDGGLAVYPAEGYRKGGAGAGEIKVSLAQLHSLGIRRSAAGTAVGNGSISVSGLAFRPSAIIVEYLWSLTGTNYFYRFTYQSTMGLFTRVRFVETSGYAPDYTATCSYTINNDGFVLNDTGATTARTLSWLAVE